MLSLRPRFASSGRMYALTVQKLPQGQRNGSTRSNLTATDALRGEIQPGWRFGRDEKTFSQSSSHKSPKPVNDSRPIHSLTGKSWPWMKKEFGFEDIVAKRKDSLYESGKRTRTWVKYKVNRGQEFVIGGYTPGNPFDALIVGYYEGQRLLYAAKVRDGCNQVRRLGDRYLPLCQSAREEANSVGL